ncbi:MAG: 3'-5' exonuclease [Vicingaceae bacterium]|nr:3'-5' exonuclease [Vicingaceae bacterium]
MYAIVDIEASGGNHINARIIEIAVYIYDGKQIVQEFNSLINPRVKIDWYVTKLTGITNAMVENAPTFNEIAHSIHSLVCDKIFVAHDVNFDYKILNTELKRTGLILRQEKLCTIELSRKIFPNQPSYSLGKLCEELGINIPAEDRHRAAGDALATTKLLEMLLQQQSTPHL